jgi:hypothetical protein
MANQQQFAEKHHWSPQLRNDTEVKVSKKSSHMDPSRKKNSRHSKEMDKEDDFLIPILQRKPPPETIKEYMVMESQISLSPPRNASNHLVSRSLEEEDISGNDINDNKHKSVAIIFTKEKFSRTVEEEDVSGYDIDDDKCKPAAIVSSSQNIHQQNTAKPKPHRDSTSPTIYAIDDFFERKVNIIM